MHDRRRILMGCAWWTVERVNYSKTTQTIEWDAFSQQLKVTTSRRLGFTASPALDVGVCHIVPFRARSLEFAKATYNRIIDKELYNISTPSIPIYSDNQSAIALASNNKFHSRTKHIDLRYHFVRAHIRNGQIPATTTPSEVTHNDGPRWRSRGSVERWRWVTQLSRVRA